MDFSSLFFKFWPALTQRILSVKGHLLFSHALGILNPATSPSSLYCPGVWAHMYLPHHGNERKADLCCLQGRMCRIFSRAVLEGAGGSWGKNRVSLTALQHKALWRGAHVADWPFHRHSSRRSGQLQPVPGSGPEAGRSGPRSQGRK